MIFKIIGFVQTLVFFGLITGVLGLLPLYAVQRLNTENFWCVVGGGMLAALFANVTSSSNAPEEAPDDEE